MKSKTSDSSKSCFTSNTGYIVDLATTPNLDLTIFTATWDYSYLTFINSIYSNAVMSTGYIYAFEAKT